jgi:putative Mn2+ efflux pump MntP
MLREAFSGEEEKPADASFGVKTMFIMAVATSIDALAVGIALAMEAKTNIWLSIAVIGGVTFAFSAAGVKLGSVFGEKYEKKARVAGGVILILLGLKILLEHLGVLPF